MSTVEFLSVDENECHSRTKRTRIDSSRLDGTNPTGRKALELGGVIDVLRNYEDYEGGINCSICGKLYKSRVCFTKHLWEHSIYWDLFDGAKNHERVLAIQAALILYSGNHGYLLDESNILSYLLVTSPHEKRKDCELTEAVKQPVKSKYLSVVKRRKRNSTGDSTDSVCSD